jgi:hypothetical protein
MSSAASPDAEPARQRLVIVAGVGRSGTSLFTSILGKVGFHVPQPEVRPDPTNPKGFGEPQWVVDFHGRNLRSRRVSVWDSRPAAYEETARAAADPDTLAELRAWLEAQYAASDQVVVKDPRVGWFLPLWARAARDIDVDVSFATLLRHPAEAVSSAIKWYGDWQTPASRTLSWVNIMLETEHATRQARRVFVRYDDLLGDWAGEMARVGAALHIPVLLDLPADIRREVDAFVDPSLHRQKVSWADLGVPAHVEELTEQVWKQFTGLADAGGDTAENHVGLDRTREAYHAFYAEAEAIAQSTIHALRPKGGAGGEPLFAGRLGHRVFPQSLRRRVPPAWKARVRRVLRRP